MIILKKVIFCTTWLWLLLSITLIGCSSYISKEAQNMFQALEEPFSVTVYPVNVVKGGTIEHDEDLAHQIITFLLQENLADPVFETTAIEIPVDWKRNQAKMAQQSAITFASKVKETGIQTDYALLVEILCNTDETKVGGVHYYLSDKLGNLAKGGLTNSHWEEFKDVQPHDRQGGYEIAVRILHNDWTQI